MRGVLSRMEKMLLYIPLSHHLDLMILFLDTSLVDTDGINPLDTVLVPASKVLKGPLSCLISNV